MTRLVHLTALVVSALMAGANIVAEDVSNAESPLARKAKGDPDLGYRLLTTKAYLPPDFDDSDIEQVWRAWPTEFRERAASASASERRRMIFERYGLTPRETGPAETANTSKMLPHQYVVDAQGKWSMNCLACHGGSVMGKPYPGAPNNRFAFELLAEEIRNSKLLRLKPLSSFDLGAMLMPLGKTRGTTNAIMFGVGLMHYRDKDLNVESGKLPPKFTHHDVDAPPWWNFKYKPFIYIDGFAAKGHRGLMQFVMVKENSGETLKSWDEEFRHIFAYLESVESPKYPFPIDLEKARRGETVFENNCSHCHGSYPSQFSEINSYEFPNRRISIDEIQTDPVRLESVTPEYLQRYTSSWLTDFGKDGSITDPGGYVAPPLFGVWASAPYFHNGSAPSLLGVLDSSKRPTVWRHQMNLDGELDANFDPNTIGIRFDDLSGESNVAESAEIFDTREFGKSNSGHYFADALSENDRVSLLEYLKLL